MSDTIDMLNFEVDERFSEQVEPWLMQLDQFTVESTSALAGDASFRRYFRVRANQQDYILMDAPPEKESCWPFYTIAKSLQNSGINVPIIYAADCDRGDVAQ